MAKNWTIAEAIAAYSNNDKNAITDIGKRFPLIADLVSRVVSGDKEATMKLFSLLPEYNTMNRLNTAAKEDLTEDDVDESEETEAEDTKHTKKAKKDEPDEVEDDGEDDEQDYGKMSGKQLLDLCRKRGLKLKSTKKEEMVKALKAADADGEAEDEEAEEEGGNDYEDMTPQELFKECKKRGIKTEPKQKASVYVKLLKADDVKADEADEDEDWDDEGEAEEKPAKNAKKSEKPAKPAKPAKKDEDDDEDWDI